MDYEMMSFHVSTSPRIFFTQVVLATKLMKDERDGVLKRVNMMGKQVKVREGEKLEVVQELQTEEDRINALERWFGVILTSDEREAINASPAKLVQTTI